MIQTPYWLRLVWYCALLIASESRADAIDQALDTDARAQQALIQSQKTIDNLDDETRRMLEKYRHVSRQAETLKTYNQHLQTLLQSQQKEQQSLQRQLETIEVTQREIVPLILNMRDTLKRFVELDLPFLPEERHTRLAKLDEMIDSASTTPAEKFRLLLESFQIENEYGHTLEAYRGDVELNGTKTSVDFLRLGRLALFFQRLDGSESGYWDPTQKRWTILPSRYTTAIRQGLRMARKEVAPDLLILPLPGAEEAKP